MAETRSFHDLIRQVRTGDSDAAAELVRRYEPTIRRAVRLRMFDRRLQRLLDSMDICQSVLANFFVRMAAGEYELDQPEQLLNLLVTMARNKLISHARKQHAECRDGRRLVEGTLEQVEFAAPDPSPSRQVAAQELLLQVEGKLLPEEKELLELRNQGLTWEQVAAQLGGSPVALRKKWSRALDRITRELGIEESHE